MTAYTGAMTFKIPCETFLRLSHAATPIPGKDQPHCFCVRIEYVDGQAYAIATNSLIAAVQYLGSVPPEFNYAVSIVPDAALLAQCAIEKDFDGELTIDVIVNEFMKFASVKTSFGYVQPGNCAYFPPDGMNYSPWQELGSWRKMAPLELPKKSKGFMFMETEQITLLGKASPSGRLVFPPFIDSSLPVVVNDAVDPEWFGLFLPREEKRPSNLSPAILPEWFA